MLLSLSFSQSILSERYTTFDELEQKINEWDQNYGQNSNPFEIIDDEGIIFHHEIIGYSRVDNLPIWAIKLSFNANIDEDEPKMLILGQCHAEEIYGLEIAVELIDWLLDPFNNANPIYIQSLLSILANSEVWIVPTHNPDGLSVVHGWYDSMNVWKQDESYRKNKYDANMNGVFDFILGIGDDIDGVDLNRNYDFNWIFGDEFNQVDTGCSSNPAYLSNYDYYRGPSPFSEPEVVAIRDFALENNFLLSVAYHSSRSGCVAEKVISSWLWEGEKAAPDLEVISRLGEEIAQLIPTQDGFSYYYPANSTSMRGNAHDWFYKETGCIQYLIEVGTSDIQSNDISIIEDTIDRNMVGLLYLLKKGAGTTIQDGPSVYQLSGKVVDSSGDPINAEVRILELDGPMLSPRYTDEFGRFRRLLKEGLFTVEVSAFGYETYIGSVSPSSSSITILDIELIKLPEYEIDIEILNPYNFNNIEGYIVDSALNDTISNIFFDDLNKVIVLPKGDYQLAVGTLNSFVEYIDFNLNESIDLSVYLKPANQISIPQINNWDNFSDTPFLIDNDNQILSQSDAVYGSELNISIRGLIDISSHKNELDNEFRLEMEMANEFEWELDKLSIFIESDDSGEQHLIKEITGHNWISRKLSFPFEYDFSNLENNVYLKLLFETDNTVNYRGFNLKNNIYISYPACPKGDIDVSGEFNVIDIVGIVGIALGLEINSDENINCMADLNGDQIVDVIDIIALVNLVLNSK